MVAGIFTFLVTALICQGLIMRRWPGYLPKPSLESLMIWILTLSIFALLLTERYVDWQSILADWPFGGVGLVISLGAHAMLAWGAENEVRMRRARDARVTVIHRGEEFPLE